MFIGHYALGLGAKRVAPAVSLGALFLACQWADLLWPTLVMAGVAPLARADDACAGFTWEVGHERKLFAGEGQSLAAGSTLAASPSLSTDRLYQLELPRQSEVKFVASPGRHRPPDGLYAGLARLTVDTGGAYRISLDQSLWVDVIANGLAIQAKAFQGRPGCSAPHKIVEFVLPAGTSLTLQISGGSVPTARIAVTRPPAE